MCGMLAQGEELSAAEAEYALSKLNQMVDMWATERLAIYQTKRAGPFNLVSGQQSYTIGAGGEWDIARPLWIDDAGIIQTTVNPNTELPMTILSKREWAQVGVKAVQSTLPRYLWYEHDFTNGLGKIWLYTVPSYANQVALYIPIAVTEFSDYTTAIALPPGYRMGLVSNLAVLLSMGSRNPQPDVMAMAEKTFGNIKAANVEQYMDPLQCDRGLMPQQSGTFDWLTGDLT